MDQLTNRFEYGARMALYIIVGMLPLWFIPWSIGLELGREITFTSLFALGIILWLLSVLTRGEIRYTHSIALYAGALLLAAASVSTIFSKAPIFSALLADPTAEKLSSLVMGLLLMIVAGSVFTSYKEVGTGILVFLFASAFAAITTLLQMLFGIRVFQILSSLAQKNDFNVIGTANGLALFYVACFAIGLGILFSAAFKDWKSWVRYGVYASLLFFFANLLVINFRTAWIILLGCAFFLFGFIFRMTKSDASETEKRRNFDWRHWGALGLLAFCVVMILVRKPIFGAANLPGEVTPSFSTTLDIAKSVYREGNKALLLGSGPGTFSLDWARYRDPAINNTIFWDTRFNQGFSWFATLAPTGGIAGVLAFVIFIGALLFLFLRSILTSGEKDTPFMMAAFLGWLALFFAAFLYPSNFSLFILFFLLTGILFSLLGRHRAPQETSLEELAETANVRKTARWDIVECVVHFEAPWLVFTSSLTIIFLLSFGAVTLYYELSAVRSAFAQQAGVNAANRGDLDESLRKFELALDLNGNDFRAAHVIAQIRIEKVRGLINTAAQGKNVQQEFQSAVSQAIQSSERAIRLLPEEPFIWRTQGALYELVTPFIDGSERFAAASYKKAQELDPAHPAFLIDSARASILYADRLQLLLNQAPKDKQEPVQNARINALKEALTALDKAIQLKSDLATAHFMRAQIALRVGNVGEAIRNVENAKIAAPFDIGIAFQLGLLYYQTNNLNQAQQEFERAVSLNANYSNARYFLGLIYDRSGDKKRATEEFGKIQALNPDNAEVKRILSNLNQGKSALDGIVPPAEAPEKRKEPPVDK